MSLVMHLSEKAKQIFNLFIRLLFLRLLLLLLLLLSLLLSIADATKSIMSEEVIKI